MLHNLSSALLWNIVGSAVLVVLVIATTVIQLTMVLRDHAKAVAMGEIPSVEDANPEKSGEEKMDMVLTAIWIKTGIPAPLIPAVDYVCGKIVEDAAQLIFDTYYADSFKKFK
jgi:cell division septation protein DedD